jgi:hypothetical protein
MSALGAARSSTKCEMNGGTWWWPATAPNVRVEIMASINGPATIRLPIFGFQRKKCSRRFDPSIFGPLGPRVVFSDIFVVATLGYGTAAPIWTAVRQ